jgi:hypothetical protein
MELVTAIYASAESRAPVKPGDLPGTSPLWRMYGDDRAKAAASRG